MESQIYIYTIRVTLANGMFYLILKEKLNLTKHARVWVSPLQITYGHKRRRESRQNIAGHIENRRKTMNVIH